MDLIKTLFWISLFIVFYTYLGYGLVLYALVLAKRIFFKNKNIKYDAENLPIVTLFIPAYNEKDYVEQKMKNTMNLNYPKNRLKIVWVTDGSNDGTNLLLQEYDNIQLFHKDEREGKINAMNRVMPFVNSPIVIFSDANTYLGKDSIKHIINCFHKQIICVHEIK